MPTRQVKVGYGEPGLGFWEHFIDNSALTPEHLFLVLLWSLLTDCSEIPVFTPSLSKFLPQVFLTWRNYREYLSSYEQSNLLREGYKGLWHVIDNLQFGSGCPGPSTDLWGCDNRINKMGSVEGHLLQTWQPEPMKRWLQRSDSTKLSSDLPTPHGFCSHSCQQVPLLSSCPGFAQ